MKQVNGYVSFVLHAHLPFVHHPESEDYLEEQWLFEANSETYIPLLINFKKLEEEKVDFRITMSMTPPLLSMLDNKLLQERYIKYLETHIELCKKELERTSYDDRLNKLSKYYLDLEKATEAESWAYVEKLQHYKGIIKKFLDQLNTSNIDLMTRSDYVLLFSVFYAYKDKLSEDGMKILYEELNSTNATAIAGSGADYSSVNIKKFLKYVDKIVYTKT
jgi:predicted glycosyl hydrolase (DUF1957 family)